LKKGEFEGSGENSGKGTRGCSDRDWESSRAADGRDGDGWCLGAGMEPAQKAKGEKQLIFDAKIKDMYKRIAVRFGKRKNRPKRFGEGRCERSGG